MFSQRKSSEIASRDTALKTPDREFGTKELWKMGGFNRRPDWFSKMMQIGSKIKKKCLCCKRYKCLKL